VLTFISAKREHRPIYQNEKIDVGTALTYEKSIRLNAFPCISVYHNTIAFFYFF
jgi:hypothetical protein